MTALLIGYARCSTDQQGDQCRRHAPIVMTDEVPLCSRFTQGEPAVRDPQTRALSTATGRRTRGRPLP